MPDPWKDLSESSPLCCSQTIGYEEGLETEERAIGARVLHLQQWLLCDN